MLPVVDGWNLGVYRMVNTVGEYSKTAKAVIIMEWLALFHRAKATVLMG